MQYIDTNAASCITASSILSPAVLIYIYYDAVAKLSSCSSISHLQFRTSSLRSSLKTVQNVQRRNSSKILLPSSPPPPLPLPQKRRRQQKYLFRQKKTGGEKSTTFGNNSRVHGPSVFRTKWRSVLQCWEHVEGAVRGGECSKLSGEIYICICSNFFPTTFAKCIIPCRLNKTQQQCPNNIIIIKIRQHFQ